MRRFAGRALHFLCWGTFAVAVAWFFRSARVAALLFVMALVVLGLLYHFGRPQPRHWAWRCLLGLPLVTAVICGAYPGWLAVHRLDDGNYGTRRIEGNGVTLIWAPGSRVLAVLSVIKEPGRQINYGTGKDVSDETIPSPPRKVCTFSY